MSAGKKLKVVYNEDHSTDVLHTRGEPVICRDCRYVGWLTEYDFDNYNTPGSCLFYSGGADPQTGERIILDKTLVHHDDLGYPYLDRYINWRKNYPLCHVKNRDGQCEDFLRAKKQSWFQRTFRRREMRK